MLASHDVFVAYAGPDRELAEALVTCLQKRDVAVRWDGHLHAEDSFATGIGDLISTCLVFAVLVSQHTWHEQHYATEELAMAVTLAQDKKMRIVPVWVEGTPPLEERPYGTQTVKGVSLTEHKGCIGCVAGLIHEVVLRRKLVDTHRELSARITAAPLPEIMPDHRKKPSEKQPDDRRERITEASPRAAADDRELGTVRLPGPARHRDRP